MAVAGRCANVYDHLSGVLHPVGFGRLVDAGCDLIPDGIRFHIIVPPFKIVSTSPPVRPNMPA